MSLGHEAKSQHGCSPTLDSNQSNKQTNTRGFELHQDVNCYFFYKRVYTSCSQMKLCRLSYAPEMLQNLQK